MEKRLVGIFFALTLAVGAISGFFLGRDWMLRRMPDITERTDTVTVRDYLPYYYPVPKDSTVIRLVDVPVTVTVNDTNVITLNANVPIERRAYQEDSTYYAVVTGPAVGDYHPSLDTLLVYRETVFIETTKTVPEYRAYRWAAGPFVSQEVGIGGFYAAKAGVQADLSLGGSGRLRFSPELGYRWTTIKDGGWYAGARFRFDLFRKR